MTRLWQWKNRRMWPLFTEYCLSTAWAFTCVISFILFLASPHGAMTLSNMALDGLAGIILSCICIAQFAVSLLIDSRYEKNLAGALFWVIWFPAIYWVLSLMTTIVAFTRVMIISQTKRARWISPDRGIERG
jgi:biofilm PGA synthesis N-glycosyltransferase PgaC